MRSSYLELIIFTLCIITFSFVIKTKVDALKIKDEMKIENESINYLFKEEIGTPNIKEEETPKKVINYEIILDIPKINLRKGILKKEDKDNNIDKNVTILKESVYPNEKGNVYIASHSGNGSKSFFNDLVKLKVQDEVYLHYKKVKYVYRVSKIEYLNKRESVSIMTCTDEDYLFLITCSQKYKNKYLIITLNKETEIN